MNRKKLAIYGEEFEEDDESSTVSKKPTQIHEEIATDERGKRRFHGAFTGGFSAGYWNTVGSKHGWVPQEFTSSRGARGDAVKQKAEDFMDAEDLGEFGIGNRSIKQTAVFGDVQKRKMAWERVDDVRQLFEDVVKPVSNSIGVRMLRSMGWREGRGVGLANVKQKQLRGGLTAEAQFDREQASKVAPSYEFANEDALVQQLTPLTGAHGLGYQGLRQSTVLDESYGKKTLALKSGKKESKGIRGQAFGVGAFEEEDESVYSNYDLSQFDFSLDVTGSEESRTEKLKLDTAFELQPRKLNPRKFYAPPRVPSNFRAEHKPIAMDLTRLPVVMKEDVKQMNAQQRARFLGEDRQGALENEKETKKEPKERRSRWDIKANEVERREQERGGEADEERDRRLRNRIEFPDEPQRQSRFKEFLHYLRRGLPYPQPTDLTVWEWEWEKKEFESKLTSEERGMLPEVQSRAQPLAKTAIAAPIFEAMASKFVKEAAGDLRVGQKDEDKLAAVKMEMFGERTRMSFEWYPDALLCKRFNVPHPYPGAEMIGVPALQKSNFKKSNALEELGALGAGIGMPNTANEIEMRERLLKAKAQRAAASKKKDHDSDEEKYEDADSSSESEPEHAPKVEKAPKSFFDVIFGAPSSAESSDAEEDSEDEEEERRAVLQKREEEMRKDALEKEQKEQEERAKIEKEREAVERREQKGIQEDDEIQIVDEVVKPSTSYGPALPPSKTLSSATVLKLLQEDLKKSKDKKKDKKKEKKSKKSQKKSKKSKKKRKGTSDESNGDEDDWEEKRK